MSIDDRLRAGLPSMLDELLPDDVRTASRPHAPARRATPRAGAGGRYAVALVPAAAVVAAVVLRVDDEPRSLEPVEPVEPPTDQVLVLDSALVRPTNRLRSRPPPTRSGSSAPPTMRPGLRSRCPPAGARDRHPPATDPASTLICVVSSCPPSPMLPPTRAVRSGISRPWGVRPDRHHRDADDGPAGAHPGRSPSTATPAGGAEVRVPAQVDLTRCAHRDRLVPFWLNGLTSTSSSPGGTTGSGRSTSRASGWSSPPPWGHSHAGRAGRAAPDGGDARVHPPLP
jgi:hypothetical protein